MSILDKVVAAVTPLESDEERLQARTQARAAAAEGSWFSIVLDHHEAIEHAFAAIRAADDAGPRRLAQMELAGLLTGHSLAEEAVLYPAMALGDQKGHSEMAFLEQSAAKVQLAGLEDLDPMSQAYLDKLEHLRGAVAHHVYEEESKWFPELAKDGDAALQARLSTRFLQEFSRYSQSAEVPFTGTRAPYTGLGNDSGMAQASGA